MSGSFKTLADSRLLRLGPAASTTWSAGQFNLGNSGGSARLENQGDFAITGTW